VASSIPWRSILLSDRSPVSSASNSPQQVKRGIIEALRITVALTPISAELLRASSRDGMELTDQLAAAVSTYLFDRSSDRGGWPYPEFRRPGDGDRSARFEIEVDEALWSSFVTEAERQSVSTEQLFEHAVLYLAASADGGGRRSEETR
jgi:hypothetical protein